MQLNYLLISKSFLLLFFSWSRSWLRNLLVFWVSLGRALHFSPLFHQGTEILLASSSYNLQFFRSQDLKILRFNFLLPSIMQVNFVGILHSHAFSTFKKQTNTHWNRICLPKQFHLVQVLVKNDSCVSKWLSKFT